MTTRREFLAITLATTLPISSLFAANKSYSLGYSSITWSGQDELAIKEISSLGFKGIQLRANTFAKYGENPAALKALIDQAGLQLCMFSSGNVEIDPAKVDASIAQHVKHANFVKTLGGTSIQLTNSLRKKGVKPEEKDLIRLAEVMNEIGAKTKEIGIQATYHNHMDQFGETPEEVELLVNHMDPSKIRLLLDVAHYFQGGGNPAEAVLKYRKVLHSLHVKDVRQTEPRYRFVELGQGKVNLEEVFANLDKIKFKGFAIVELDAVPDAGKTPLSCAETSKEFLKGKIHYPFS
ncbi:sugar phosphate isomerase/epimerase family protein [Aquirufa lenticrescens]|uniref:sugar phosphate isomerase/epimerase family protein n=1 Tax=Aquirufa lenticrescens TaxID=2696560 RepID=UPI001CAA777D|nr:sugar phosphate isomerase/epimerase [Aquirufa lenticrescens]UAJ14708.1 sugar phosphate isomerase/epimerase [Aquirufa lenticrescens]